MKYLEQTPDFICNPEDTNYCAYVDTDSNYFHAEPLLKYLYPNFDEMTESEKDDVLEEVALKYQDLITGHYDNLAKNTFNVYKFPWFKDREKDHWLEMKTECVIRSAYFRSTRRYAQWITKQEGIKKETLDIKGLEFKKSNFPPILGKFFKKALVDILKGTTQKEIDDRIKKFKSEIITGKISLIELGNPTSVKTLNNYIAQPAKAGEMFSKPAKGAPASVKSTIAYNDLLKFWGLNKQHSFIAQGDKVKWIYLKPNIYQIEALSYLPFDIPKKILTFMETHADRQKIFDSILLNKLENFYDDLGWTLNLNSNINKFFEL